MITNWGAEGVGVAAAVCTTVSFVPQLLRVWRRKRADDISLAMFLIYALGVVLWLVYGVEIGAFAVVLAIGGRNFPVLVSEAYNWQHFNQAPAIAAAYAVVVMAISLAATVVYLRVLRTPAAQRA